MKTVVYNLSQFPTTFDFAVWCCAAKTCGAKSVHFFVDGEIACWKYSKDIAWKRFANILIPLCAIARLEYTFGTPVIGVTFSYLLGHLDKLYRDTGRIEKLSPNKTVNRKGYVTITLRDSFRNKWRNSNTEAWSKFEKYLSGKNVDYVVFPECEDAPMNLEDRMALYANADMNLGVSNGPMVLCLLSEAPYLTFNRSDNQFDAQYDDVKMRAKQGFPVGSQLSFRNDKQYMVYGRDDYEIIVRAYEDMQDGKFATKQERQEIAA